MSAGDQMSGWTQAKAESNNRKQRAAKRKNEVIVVPTSGNVQMAWATYQAVERAAWDAYDAVEAPAWKAYLAAVSAAWGKVQEKYREGEE